MSDCNLKISQADTKINLTKDNLRKATQEAKSTFCAPREWILG